MKMLLTSNGLTNQKLQNVFLGLVKNDKNKKILILATKYLGNVENIYSLSVKENFKNLGFLKADIVDLENCKNLDFQNYDIFYVCGGNTFSILKFAREANLKEEIEKLFKRNGVYVGVSAGSIIVGPNINIAGEVEPDINEINLQDLEGMQFVENIICPHYLEEHESQVLNFEKKYNVKVNRISDEEAVLVDGKIIEKI